MLPSVPPDTLAPPLPPLLEVPAPKLPLAAVGALEPAPVEPAPPPPPPEKVDPPAAPFPPANLMVPLEFATVPPAPAVEASFVPPKPLAATTVFVLKVVLVPAVLNPPPEPTVKLYESPGTTVTTLLAKAPPPPPPPLLALLVILLPPPPPPHASTVRLVTQSGVVKVPSEVKVSVIVLPGRGAALNAIKIAPSLALSESVTVPSPVAPALGLIAQAPPIPISKSALKGRLNNCVNPPGDVVFQSLLKFLSLEIIASIITATLFDVVVIVLAISDVLSTVLLVNVPTTSIGLF